MEPPRSTQAIHDPIKAGTGRSRLAQGCFSTQANPAAIWPGTFNTRR
jgi:hypothetical protein